MGGRIRHERRNARRAALGPRAQGWIGGGQPKRIARNRQIAQLQREPTPRQLPPRLPGCSGARRGIGPCRPPFVAHSQRRFRERCQQSRLVGALADPRGQQRARLCRLPCCGQQFGQRRRISLPARHGRRPPQIADCRGVIALRECTKMGFVQQRRVAGAAASSASPKAAASATAPARRSVATCVAASVLGGRASTDPGWRSSLISRRIAGLPHDCKGAAAPPSGRVLRRRHAGG